MFLAEIYFTNQNDIHLTIYRLVIAESKLQAAEKATQWFSKVYAYDTLDEIEIVDPIV